MTFLRRSGTLDERLSAALAKLAWSGARHWVRQKEEPVLFPMAHQILDEETLTQLGIQGAQRRDVMPR